MVLCFLKAALQPKAPYCHQTLPCVSELGRDYSSVYQKWLTQFWHQCERPKQGIFCSSSFGCDMVSFRYYWLFLVLKCLERAGSLYFSFLCYMMLLTVKLERDKAKFSGEIWLSRPHKCTLLNFGLFYNTCGLRAQQAIKGRFVI